MATFAPISALVQLALAGIKGSDFGVVVDVNDQTQAPTGSTKKFLLSDLRTAFMLGGALAGFATTDALSVQSATITGPNVSINGQAYAFPASQTANGFLKTDGAGTLTWVTEASGISLAGLDDVALSGLATGHVLVYNAGTSKWTNSLGADISVNGITVGRGANNLGGNVFIGDLSGSGITSGVANTGGGFHALANNQDASGNTAFGYQSQGAIGTGNGANSSFGYQSSAAMTSGTLTAGFGFWSLRLCTIGSNNAAGGYNSMSGLTSGNYNAGWGYATLLVNNGSFNLAAGAFALEANTSGSTSVALGYQSGKSNVSGSGLVLLGNFSGAYELGSNAFYVNNQDRTNTAGDQALSLLYGTFASTAVAQALTFNVGTAAFNSGADASMVVTIGNGGAGPTSTRSADLILNAATSVGTPGRSRVRYQFAGSDVWRTGTLNSVVGTMSALTDFVFDPGTGTPVASITAAGLMHAASAVVVGTDPATADPLRVGGGGTFSAGADAATTVRIGNGGVPTAAECHSLTQRAEHGRISRSAVGAVHAERSRRFLDRPDLQRHDAVRQRDVARLLCDERHARREPHDRGHVHDDARAHDARRRHRHLRHDRRVRRELRRRQRHHRRIRHELQLQLQRRTGDGQHARDERAHAERERDRVRPLHGSGERRHVSGRRP